MKYRYLAATVDVSDAVNVGWRIFVSPRRVKFVYHSRWAGSTDGTAYAVERTGAGPVTEEEAGRLLMELQFLLANDYLRPRRGMRWGKWTVLSAGYLVR